MSAPPILAAPSVLVELARAVRGEASARAEAAQARAEAAQARAALARALRTLADRDADTRRLRRQVAHLGPGHPLSVPCPLRGCQAPAGRPCTPVWAPTITHPHTARQYAAQEAHHAR